MAEVSIRARETIASWPDLSAEAARLVIDTYGEPHEISGTELRWFGVGPWKRIIAQRWPWEHRFPAPHHDSVESFIDLRVPVDKYSAIAEFDGSVMAERTTGELSARCHDEQANLLALNLAHEIITDRRSVDDARAYYAREFLDARRNRPTPYMEGLRFTPSANASDPDEPVLSDDELAAASAQSAPT